MKNETLEKEWLLLERNLGYYFSRIIGRPLCPPDHVYFSLTNRCNLKCKMCSVSSAGGRIEDELSLEQCKNILNQIAGLKIEHIIFSGGEPILRKDIFRMIEYAVAKKIKQVSLISNGLLIDDEIAQRLSHSGLGHITLSIDGLECANDFVRGQGAFKRALATIDAFSRAREVRTVPTVGINFTIMDCNIDDMVPMIELARSKQCNIIVFQPMLSDNTQMHERKKNELWVSERNIGKLRKAISKVLELKRATQDLSIHVDERILELIPDYFAGTLFDKDLKCYEGISRIVITCDGGLWTCQGLYGNLRKGRLRKYWFSKEARNIRNKVDRCRAHCLQSCVHLMELSDIYSGVDRFTASIADAKEGGEYSRKLIKSLKGYEFLLKRKRSVEFFKNIFRGNNKIPAGSLNGELSKISKSIANSHKMARGR